MIKLIALDVDGTLVDAENIVSPENETAVKMAVSLGARVALVTGRHRDGVKKVLEVLGLCSEPLVIANNGALIYWGNKILREHFLAEDDADRVIRFSAQLSGTVVAVFQPDIIYFYLDSSVDREYVMKKFDVFDMNRIAEVKNPGEIPREHVTKVMLITRSEDCAREVLDIWPKNLSHLNCGRSYPYICEINSGRCNKGESLKFLCDKLGIRSQEVLAVGDGETDIPMLAFAGRSVFVRHSKYLPKLAPHVEITPDGFQHRGVAWAIERYLSLQMPEQKILENR
ncbi:MAG: Cof-type HAD-IIB family hydrolase [Tepidanaerobacteraceae bacterium]|nr:Cof-type HAD-IIB family hydrolase [Tepidanaerobacteraceae bacterium]